MFLGALGGGEEEATGHLIDRGVLRAFHPYDPRFPPVHTGDGAHLHTRGVRDVDFGADERVIGIIPPPLGGGGVVLGAGVAFVAGGGGVGGAGLFLAGGGGMAQSNESSDSKCH